jgi:outer membrane receptor protein involved in Fe transport
VNTGLAAAAAILLTAMPATAQTTNGSIAGRVVDAQALPVPGVTITAQSPNLQGAREVISSASGEYLVDLLPPGTYTVRFALSGFQPQEKTVSLAPTQRVPLDATLGMAEVTETVNVVGRASAVLADTPQSAANFPQELIETLPMNRDINSSLLLAPAVHPTGPGGNYSIAGAMSYDSLYLINGVTVNENLRGQPNSIYIEDAIQTTTIAASGISAEYGRFGGGVVNVVTKSGGNNFSGSFREALYNDNWRAKVTDFAADTKVDDLVPVHEYTIGGPVVQDRLWFFTAGRLQNTSEGRTLAVTKVPYTFEDNSQRYEAKLTYTANTNHRLQGSYAKVNRTQVNDTFNQATSIDTNSLYTRTLPQDLVTLNYSGILSPNLLMEARVSSRRSSTDGSGSRFTDPINGTMLLDFQKGYRWWSPTFCGVCDPESRDNDEVFVKGTYFVTPAGGGSHDIAFGYDTFNDKRFANNHQSGSDYRIYAAASTIVNGTIYPIIPTGFAYIEYDPIIDGSQGTNFRTHALFANDTWRYNDHVTFDLGVRFDKNHGVDSAGHLVAKDSAWSPRLGVVFDPSGDGVWTFTGSVARYVSAVNNGIANAASAAGNPTGIVKVYLGPNINTSASPSTDSATAIQGVFDAMNGAGGFLNAPWPIIFSQVPGLSVTIPNGLVSPNVWEYAGGAARQVGSRAAVRADFTYRNYRDFYVNRIDSSTGVAVDSFGNHIDVGVLGNTNDLTRRYAGLTLTGTYRIGGRSDVGGTYTLSRLWGNFDGENVNSGPVGSDAFSYPEYRQMSWYAPEGDLAGDQRHRARLWLNVGVPNVDGLTLSLLQDMSSGTPYGAVGPVDARPYVGALTYATPQGSSTESYYFTARDAFRTEASIRTDFAANYGWDLHSASRVWQLFVQAQVINLFNNSALCGCGATVFSNGGAVSTGTINQTVLTGSNAAGYAKFNPLTTSPVEGVNWATGSQFGTAVNRFAYTSPRSFNVSFGVRF